VTYAEVGRVTISDGGVAPDSAVLKMPAALLTSLALGQMVASGGDFLTRNGFATLVRAPPVPASPGGVATTRRGIASAAPHEEGIASAAPPWRGIASAAPR